MKNLEYKMTGLEFLQGMIIVINLFVIFCLSVAAFGQDFLFREGQLQINKIRPQLYVGKVLSSEDLKRFGLRQWLNRGEHTYNPLPKDYVGDGRLYNFNSYIYGVDLTASGDENTSLTITGIFWGWRT